MDKLHGGESGEAARYSAVFGMLHTDASSKQVSECELVARMHERQSAR